MARANPAVAALSDNARKAPRKRGKSHFVKSSGK